MKPYDEGQLRTINVLKDYYGLVSEVHHCMSETMKLILDLHGLRDRQGWERSDEIYFQSLIYQ